MSREENIAGLGIRIFFRLNRNDERSLGERQRLFDRFRQPGAHLSVVFEAINDDFNVMFNAAIEF